MEVNFLNQYPCTLSRPGVFRFGKILSISFFESMCIFESFCFPITPIIIIIIIYSEEFFTSALADGF